tara:strand:- start:686 stop:1192 length:507 start_codon:yes stop_codon:yes gene_type:complete
MKTGTLFLFIILSIIYLCVTSGLIFLAYRYIKYINDLEAKNCKCSEDDKRDMVKNFSYLILISWGLFILTILVSPPRELLNIFSSRIFSLVQFLLVAGYGSVLFLYSKKLIDESCKCSESWVREAMQYQSYVYIFFSIISFLIFIAKIIVGNDMKDFKKVASILRNKK